jgi:hypothetical protein
MCGVTPCRLLRGNRHFERSKRPQITTTTYLQSRGSMTVSLVAQYIQWVFSNIHDFTFVSANFNGNIDRQIHNMPYKLFTHVEINRSKTSFKLK